MTRNLAICVVPTVIALLAIYWFRKKKKVKPRENSTPCLTNVHEKQDESQIELSFECTSDFANTLSDASSFTSPVSSEKSLRTNSPSYSSLLHDVAEDSHIHSVQTLSNCIDKTFNTDFIVQKDKDFFELKDLQYDTSKIIVSDSKQLDASSSDLNSLDFENIKAETTKYNNLQQLMSPNFIPSQNVDFYKTNSIYLSDNKENSSVGSEEDTCLKVNDPEIWNNHSDIDRQNELVQENNYDNIANSVPSCPDELEKIIEADSHSSVFDENSLSYVSDDSEGKQLTECKNKDSLSSVLDENSLLSSFCEELEKSTDSNNHSAVISKPEHYDSGNSECPEDVLNLTPLRDLTLFLQDTDVSNNEEILNDSSFHKIFEDSNFKSSNALVERSHLLYEDITSTEKKIMQNEPGLVTSAVQQDSVAVIKQVPNDSSDFNGINSICMSDGTSGLQSSDTTTCHSEAEFATAVQNIFSDLNVSLSLSLKDNSTCDSSDSEANLKCSPGYKNEPLSESSTLMVDQDSVNSNLGCDTCDSALSEMSELQSDSKADQGRADSSIHVCNHPSTWDPNDKTPNHLDAAADVVQRISSDLNSSLSMLLENNSAWKSPNLNANLKWSPTWSKKESSAGSKTSVLSDVSVDSKCLCDTSNNELSLEKSNCLEETGDYKPTVCSKISKTDVSKIAINKTFGSENSSDSSSWEGNENNIKVTNQVKKESNGILDVKVPPQSSNEFVYEFELPQELCGRLIGKHGRHVKSIMERSNANVFIKRHPYDPLLKVVVVEGHRSDVNDALEIIRRKYPPSQFPTVTLVQTNVVGSAGVPLPESLQLHLPEGASCDVILSSLVSAGHFFLQQPTHPTYPSLSTLDQCMINLYSQMDTPLLPQPIEAGVICAAPVYRGWYRAQVVYVCDNSSDCGIKFVDYGGFSQVPISSLRQIRSDFMSLPFQASECYLAHVRPVGSESWSSEATSIFEELAQGQILQALLVEYADDGIPCVYLYRVQGVSSTFINKELVERGLAVWVNSNHWDPH